MLWRRPPAWLVQNGGGQSSQDMQSEGEGRMCGTHTKLVFYSEPKEELAIRKVLTKRASVTGAVQVRGDGRGEGRSRSTVGGVAITHVTGDGREW